MPGQGDQKIDYNDPNQRFHITAEIAPTLQGRIYAATDLKTGTYTVIKETWKQLVASKCSRDGTPVPEDFFEETRILNKLSVDPTRHLHFVHIICQWEEPLTYNYAMEGCKFGDLFDFVKNKHLRTIKSFRAGEFAKREKHFRKNCLPKNTKDPWIISVRHMFRQLVDCLSWMNDRGIAHLDMSLENTMVYHDKTCNIKIIDFGLARDCTLKKSWKFNKRVGKRGYMAPEVYAKQEYDCRKADVWSIGVMLYMMLIGAPPYEIPQLTCVPFKYLVNGRLREMLTHWKRLHYVTDDIIDLLISIFRVERKRTTIEQIKKHPFVNLYKEPLYKDKQNKGDKGNEKSVSSQQEEKQQQQQQNGTNNVHLSPTLGSSQAQESKMSVHSTSNVSIPEQGQSFPDTSQSSMGSAAASDNINDEKQNGNYLQNSTTKPAVGSEPSPEPGVAAQTNAQGHNNNDKTQQNSDSNKNNNKNNPQSVGTEDANENRPTSTGCCRIM